VPDFIQAWEVTYPDRPLDVIYDQHIALERWGNAPGAEMNALTIIRHEDGTRTYMKGAIAAEVKANWQRRGKA
jgi:hypothetical protein